MSKRDGAWEHGTEVEGGNNKKMVRCNFCSKVVGSITRLKHHLLGSSTDVKKCPSVPQAVKTEVQLQEEGRRARKNQRTALQSDQSSHGTQQENGNGSGDALEEDALALQVIRDSWNAAADRDSADALAVAVVPPVSSAEPADPEVVIAFKGLTGACTEDAVFGVYPNCIPLAYMKFEEALQFICSSIRQSVGIIASAKAADVYALGVLAKGIEGVNKSFTRFWILGRDPVVPRRTDELFKTSIAFTLKDGTQNLAWALLAFSQRDIKVTKVEIRPQLQLSQMAGSSTSGTAAECFDYVFFVDFENSTADDGVCNALRHLKELATSVRVLGSYPVMEVNSSDLNE